MTELTRRAVLPLSVASLRQNEKPPVGGFQNKLLTEGQAKRNAGLLFRR
jgi:hypothetical protein